jgi:Zn-finger nucleic acid-binding protein
MSERREVEIDYCPQCRGVWLDRGELDKIIERAATQERHVNQTSQQPAQPSCHPREPNHGNGHAHGYGYSHGHGHKPHRKKSFLEELFD